MLSVKDLDRPRIAEHRPRDLQPLGDVDERRFATITKQHQMSGEGISEGVKKIRSGQLLGLAKLSREERAMDDLIYKKVAAELMRAQIRPLMDAPRFNLLPEGGEARRVRREGERSIFGINLRNTPQEPPPVEPEPED